MTKVLCKCCHRTAKVTGSHEFEMIDKCRNGTFIETGRAANPRIGGRNMNLIHIWDDGARKFVPLLAD